MEIEHFNIPGNTDLLISSKIYLHLLKQGQIHNGENFPVIQAIKLGWIIAGHYHNPNNMIQIEKL